jgi:GNAT superfamily N-acetyltransferase
MISLRPAQPEDAEAIGQLFARSRRVLSFLPELHSVAEDLAFIRDQVMVKCRVTVALRDGGIGGFMAETPGWIEQFYIDPRQLRTGVGSLLLEQAKQRNRRLELWCFRDNAGGRAFYQKHGFVAIEETDGSGNEAGAPDIRYRWERPA